MLMILNLANYSYYYMECNIESLLNPLINSTQKIKNMWIVDQQAII